MFAQADQDVRSAEVFVPGRVEDAVGCSEDPLVADQARPAQQLLRAPFVQHHLPADGIVSASSSCGKETSLCCGRQGSAFASYHGAEATSASSPPTMRFSRYDCNNSSSLASFLFIFSNMGRWPQTLRRQSIYPVQLNQVEPQKVWVQKLSVLILENRQ